MEVEKIDRGNLFVLGQMIDGKKDPWKNEKITCIDVLTSAKVLIEIIHSKNIELSLNFRGGPVTKRLMYVQSNKYLLLPWKTQGPPISWYKWVANCMDFHGIVFHNVVMEHSHKSVKRAIFCTEWAIFVWLVMHKG